MFKKQFIFRAFIASLFLISVFFLGIRKFHSYNTEGFGQNQNQKKLKLYWFIPDGLRAEPDVFQIFKWADEGKLPNLKKMMELGTYGYSIPIFPGHTPSNFATLFTGLLPKDHGIVDGPLRLKDYPLKIVPMSGFSSVAKLRDPLWYTIEQQGLVSSLLTVPGSTPPEISRGQIVRGRWGGWGIDFPSVIFHSSEDTRFRQILGKNDRAFNIGKRFTLFVKSQNPSGWNTSTYRSFSPAFEIPLSNWDFEIFALAVDTTDDHTVNYDQLLLSRDKKNVFQVLKLKEWGDWFIADLKYPIQKSYQDEHPQKSNLEQKLTRIDMPVNMRLKIIFIKNSAEFRIRAIYDGMNKSVVQPTDLDDHLRQAAGPMLDFPDDYPPQLIYYPEDKNIFLQESSFSFMWHKKALQFLLDHGNQDVIIHNIYTPNQFLTSRWWMPYEDPKSLRYSEISKVENKEIHEQTLQLYQQVDSTLGIALEKWDGQSYIVLSSDHGIAALNYEVRLNNLFIKKGWLKVFKDHQDGLLKVDWKNSKVIFLQSYHVYINPFGLDGVLNDQKGIEYEKLKSEVMKSLSELKEGKGESPFQSILFKSEVQEKLGLSSERVGDIVLVYNEGYCATEDLSEDGLLFYKPLKGGYKQGVLPSESKALWTPFIAIGPGIKNNNFLKDPISHLDQYPFIMKLLKANTDLELKNAQLKDALLESDVK